MKCLGTVFLIWTCYVAASFGDIVTNQSPVVSQGIKIVWSVPKEVWPRDHIWIYKVIPQEFSDAVISNAMGIGAFTMKDKVKLSAEAYVIDKKALVFKNKDETKWLNILPTLGYMEYYDGNAEAKAVSEVKDVPEPVVGVPELTEATNLGLKYMRLLGIDLSQIAKKPGTCDFDLHWVVRSREWIDQKTKRNVREIQSFGVDFTRCIDGVEMSGFGDVFVEFGNNAKISKLEVSWRNFQPHQLLGNLITPQEIVNGIERNKIKIPPIDGWENGRIKSITITNAAFRYSRQRGDEPMDYLRPVLQLDALIGDGQTNAYVWFQTAISSDRR